MNIKNFKKISIIIIFFISINPVFAVSDQINVGQQVIGEVVCNNGICEPGEDYINCPSDCPPPPSPPSSPPPPPLDITPPVIYNLLIKEITLDSAEISWKTNEFALCQLFLGKTQEYEEKAFSEITFSLSHKTKLTELSSETTYYFKIECQDDAQNKSEIKDQKFTTLTPPPFLPPEIPPEILPEVPPEVPPEIWLPEVPLPIPPEKPEILSPPVAPSFLEKIIENVKKEIIVIPKTIEKIRKNPTIKKIVEEPTVDGIVKVVNTVAMATAVATGLTGLIPLATRAGDFLYLPIRILTFLGVGFGFIRRKKEWGVVYDSVTKQPLDPVRIILKDKDNKEIKSVITDMQGRFGFLVSPGQYYLEAKKTNYQFPTQKILTDKDEIYDNIYKGELLTITDPNVMMVNIAMDPIGFDWNEIAKRNYIKFNYLKEKIKRFLPDFIFLLGFIFSVLFWFFKPTLFNKIIVIIFMLLWVLRKLGFHKRVWGMLLRKEVKIKKPLSFAILRLFYKGTTKPQIAHAITDVNGRYYCLVEPETYDIIIEEKKEIVYELVKKISNVKIKKKVLNKDFEL